MRTLIKLAALLLLISSCRMADIRSKEIKEDKHSPDQIAYAKDLLQSALKKQGMDKMDNYSTYEMSLQDNWKGMLGAMGRTWPWKEDKFQLRFGVGNFDGQVESLEGKHKGFIAGIQSFEYYEQVGGEMNKEVKDNARIMFSLAAFHYFFELGDRLAKAPFIRYMGEDVLDGKKMRKVYTSWGSERSKDYDQYILWIGEESGLIEASTYTIRENFLPMSSALHGSIRFTDFQEVDGILIPFTQSIQMSNPKDNLSNHIHQVKVIDFSWDTFPASDLRPFPELEIIGDSKPKV